MFWRGVFSSRAVKVLLVLSVAVNLLLIVKFYYDARCLVGLGGDIPWLGGRKLAPYSSFGNTSLESQPIVFVGGVPRSGTTLARAMLDAHPEVRCGEETRVLPRIMGMRARWDNSEKEHQRLLAAGLSGEILDRATRAFVSQIIIGHGQPAKYLCNKDPLLLNYMNELLRIYPKAKFVLMIRDGRAVAYSIVSRNVTISGVDNKSYVSAALFWNKVVNKMSTACRHIGPQHCMAVRYEELVASPREVMGKMLQFLHIPWHENILHHHELINTEVSLSKMEPSSNQVKEAVHTAAIEKWREKLPLKIQKKIYAECDMLKELGYKI